MRRREFIALGGAAAALVPLRALAQAPGRIYRIGALQAAGRQAPQTLAFFDELRLNGFIEGQNLEVVPGGFDARSGRLTEEASTIVMAAPDVIIGGAVLALRALQAATRTVPIVGMTEDMVAEGLVTSLSRPGGNITGISLLSPELDDKRQGILIEAVPGVRRMAALSDSEGGRPSHLRMLQEAARGRGIELLVFGVAGPGEIAPAINAARTAGAEAFNFLATPLFSVHRRVVFERVAAQRVPAIYQWPEMAEDGGVLAYGPRLSELYRQRARMVVKILRGAKPADVPVEQPTKFELIVNLKNAKAMGHDVPAGLVLRADKVIE
jgi:putative ABC transport system substrate-binding protein